MPYTALRTSIFFDNFITFFQYQSMCALSAAAVAFLVPVCSPCSSPAHQMSWARLKGVEGQGNHPNLCPWHAHRDGAKVWCDNLGTAPLAAHAVADIGGTAAGVVSPPL